MSAHRVVVDNLVLPARLGGHPSLDFCNTWAGWDGQETGDYLADYEHLAIFAGFVGVLPKERAASLRRKARRQRKVAASVLDRARHFRAALYDVLRNGVAAPGWDLVAKEVETAAAARRLRRVRDGVRWEFEPALSVAAPVVAIAWSAGELLSTPDVQSIRACPGVGCGWLFLDRRGRRRWCTMEVCGNRAKARRFAARRRTH